MTQVVTTVASQINRALQALKKDDATFKSVSAALVAETLPDAKAITPKAPAKTNMTPDLQAAVAVLPSVLGRVQPDRLRELSEVEVQDLHAEREALAEIVKTLATREKAIGQIIRGHMSMVAARTGEATNESEVDNDGFPIVGTKGDPHRFNIPGTSKAWSLERVEGTVGIDVDVLEDLVVDGVVTRKEYLAMTKTVRVFDETKTMNAIEKDPSLLGVLRRITTKGRARQSLYTRNAK